ncbi:hypothetical protein K435DRAFT_848878 [Dendrothele bispora CBS 962.96]|uniref:Uncharacterized protein n=1 Tax=Dendrothele bispora (strain CBS 962.96) TaxID=1314807 RepID=A0A4S8LFD6_DENBC|nr:hypothetical protein K435DRAFT_681207 [Dendrothele bispora CBS 962.96]THV06813.1 hypothetical protein K435DRAFT_848878 [Dendrothele bispora CBS 962.96]
MPPPRNKSVFNVPSFFGMVGAVMAALKLKEHYDGYNRVSNDEEGRVALASDEDDVQLLDTQIRNPALKRQRKKGCCICCGLDCTLFWKAFGIVFAGFAIWYLVKFVFWAAKPSPTGLENMPEFSTSLACMDAQYIYNGGETSIQVAVGTDGSNHALDIHGSAIGTIVLTEAAGDATEVEYKITIRSSDKDLLEKISLQYPSADDGEPVANSRLYISTPGIEDTESSCLRYDITMYIPKNLKKLHVGPHAASQVKFDPHARIDLNSFYVTLFSLSEHNMILPAENFRSNKLALEVYRGWIVGDVSIVNTTAITTQRGNGVANVHVHPTAPLDPAVPDPVFLQTTTGAGRTDVFFIADKAFPHRPIRSVHTSSRYADVYLNYGEAEYSGRIQLDSKSYSATNTRSFNPVQEPVNGNPRWTHWVGDEDGEDKMFVKSKGWTGLYF